jgi:cyclophilin family peptidyl-prolyl cis-trans isomerase
MIQGRPMLTALFACAALLGLYVLAAPAGAADDANDPAPRVVIATNKGNITVELDRAKAPGTVANFLGYVDKKHYDGTIFHRVIPDFMIQGGGIGQDLREKATGAGIKNEAKAAGLRNARGTIAMARTSNPDSATAQFFINLTDNDFLDFDKCQDGVGYTVFGRVVDGQPTVDAIAKVPTTRNRVSEGFPNETIVIQSITRAAK